mgnify:FL=1
MKYLLATLAMVAADPCADKYDWKKQNITLPLETGYVITDEDTLETCKKYLDKNVMSEWDILAFDGGKYDGPGYGGKITKNTSDPKWYLNGNDPICAMELLFKIKHETIELEFDEDFLQEAEPELEIDIKFDDGEEIVFLFE